VQANGLTRLQANVWKPRDAGAGAADTDLEEKKGVLMWCDQAGSFVETSSEANRRARRK
jgi:hypothetical protein